MWRVVVVSWVLLACVGFGHTAGHARTPAQSAADLARAKADSATVDAARTAEEARAAQKRAANARRMRLIIKRSLDAELNRSKEAASGAERARTALAARVPASLRPHISKGPISKAHWPRMAFGGSAERLRKVIVRERLRAAIRKWQLGRSLID